MATTTTTTNTEKKLTKRDYFGMLRELPEVQAHPELVAFIDREVGLLDKKNSGNRKPTANQLANDALRKAIYAAMQDNRLYTVGELIKEVPECADLSAPKVTSQVTAMVKDGRLVNTKDKRKSYYSKAPVNMEVAEVEVEEVEVEG